MEMFRKLYYKLATLLCFISTFVIVFNIESGSTGYAIFCIFVGLVCFGSWSVGKAEIDPDKPIRNILLLLLWSMLGFGITAIGVTALISEKSSHGLLMAFLVIMSMALLIVYLITIIKNLDWFAILSVVLIVVGCVIAGNASGKPVLMVLSLIILAASIVCFVISIIKGILDCRY